MALIARELKVERETVPFRLPKELAVKVGLYAQFLESGRDYVVTQVLHYVIDRDREFAAWLSEHGAAVPEPASAPRGRGRPRTKTPPLNGNVAEGTIHVAAHR